MCRFFSLVSDGKGNVFYFDAKLRKKILSGKLDFNADSHTSIATHFGFNGKKEDKLNKYEFNPLTRVLTVDQINTKDDSSFVESFCNSLDFKTIVPELNIKPIVNALEVPRKNKKPTKEEIKKLKKFIRVGESVWNSVWNSVGVSVRDSVWNSLVYSAGESVCGSVWNSVWNSVGDSVWNSAGESVCGSVCNSVWNSVGVSVGVSVWAYIGSFVTLKEWKYCEKVKYKKGANPFQSCIDLWEAGLVPSFDGKTWRLHSGKNAEIVYSWTPTKTRRNG